MMPMNFTPLKNIEKMSNGISLTDEDRLPWLKALNHLISVQKSSAVIACSALKKYYRELLNVPGKNIKLIYLKGDQELIKKRLENRKGHYAGADLLDSQFQTLEEPENALTLDIIDIPEVIVEKILREFRLK